MPGAVEPNAFESDPSRLNLHKLMSPRDAQIDHILNALDDLRAQARSEGLNAMSDTISRAFETCLASYLGEKEAELMSRISTRR